MRKYVEIERSGVLVDADLVGDCVLFQKIESPNRKMILKSITAYPWIRDSSGRYDFIIKAVELEIGVPTLFSSVYNASDLVVTPQDPNPLDTVRQNNNQLTYRAYEVQSLDNDLFPKVSNFELFCRIPFTSFVDNDLFIRSSATFGVKYIIDIDFV